MKKNIFKALTLFIAVSSLSSCLKDDSLILDPEKGTNVIEFANPAQISSPSGSILPLYAFSVDANPSATIPVSVSYSGPEAGAPDDITVNVAVGTTAQIDKYNTEQGSHYEILPTSNYTLSATQVVIKKGESKATFNVLVKPTTFDFTKSLVLPLTITSASSGTISGNFNTILVNINVKNRYDGVYRHTYTSTLGNGTNTVSLVTTGANTVRLDPGLLGVYSNAQTLTIDPTTNQVTVSMTTLLPITNNPASKYDPATKTFTVKYTSNGGARTFDETYVYTGPR